MTRAFAAGLVLAVSLASCKYVFPVREMMKGARTMEAARRYPEAKDIYEKLIREHPESPEAVEALSRVATIYEEHMQNWQKAAAYLQELKVRTRGKLQHAQVLLRLGRVLERGGPPYKDALEVYGMICQDCGEAPESVQALLALGRIHESMQDWPAAKQDYELAILKLGSSPQAETIRVRLQSVWLLEVLGAYFTGRMDEAVKLAKKALARAEAPALEPGKSGATVMAAGDCVRLTLSEVRRGLEDLLRRHRSARHLWAANAGMVILDDVQVGEDMDPARFIIKAVSRQTFAGNADGAQTGSSSTAFVSGKDAQDTLGLQPVPGGWRLAFKEKGRGFTIQREPGYEGLNRQAWSFSTGKKHIQDAVEGFWFSSDGGTLGWLGRNRTTRATKIRLLNLRKLEESNPISDSSGKILGYCLLLLPYCDKMVFPFGDYIAVSDLRGMHRVIFNLPAGYLMESDGSRGPLARFSGKNVEWMACSVDGIEVAVAVRQTTGNAKGRLAVWKLALGAGGE